MTVKHWLNPNQASQGVQLIYGGDWRQRTQIFTQLANRLSGEYVSVGHSLPELLLKIPEPASRVKQLPTILAAILPKKPLVLVDHLEVLLQGDLRFALLDWFTKWTYHRAVLLSWPGEANPIQNLVHYAVPGHPDYFRAYLRQVTLISMTEITQWF